MKHTCIGILADALGHAHDHRGRHWATGSLQYRSAQNSTIRVDTDHDHQQVGQVLHLERDLYDRLWCVAEIEPDAITPHVNVKVAERTVHVPVDTYWSSERLIDDSDDTALLTWVSLTSRPARVAPEPISIYPGPLTIDSVRQWNVPPSTTRSVLRHAAVAWRARRYGGGAIVVRDAHAHTHELLPRASSGDTRPPGDPRPPGGEIWRGQPGRIISIR